MGREIGVRFKREVAYVYLWLIHVDVWQKPIQFCKANILQLKNKSIKNFKKFLCLSLYLIIIIEEFKKKNKRKKEGRKAGREKYGM